MHFKVSAVLPIDAHTFLVERDSAAFRALVAKTQKLGALEIEDGWTDGDVQVFKLVTKPDIDRFVPKTLQHYIAGGSLEYTDIIRYDPKHLARPPFKLLVHSIPPVFRNKTMIDCELTIEEVGPGQCRQTLEGDVTINILGIGRIAERIISSSLHDVYSGIPEIVERWNLFRDEVLQQPDGREVLFNGRPPLQENWVSEQVASVLRLPYKAAAAAVHAAEERLSGDGIADGDGVADGDSTADGTVNGAADSSAAAAATAKPLPGLQAATPSAAATAGAAGGATVGVTAASGKAKDVEESVAEQRRAGLVGGTAAVADGGAAGGQRLRPSPFAGVIGRLSFDSSRTSHEGSVQADRLRSVANFEGELFYEPDDIPDGIDAATADSMRSDQAEAMDWYRHHSATEGAAGLPAVSVIEEEGSDSASEGADAKRKWWRRHSRSRSQGGEPVSPAVAPSGPSLAHNVQNYSHWVAFWERQSVASQETAPKAATRLGHLFGVAVKLGVVKAAATNGGNASGRSGGSSPAARKKSVGFAHPLVASVREATPGVSDDEDSVYDPSRDKFCFCFPMPRQRR